MNTAALLVWKQLLAQLAVFFFKLVSDFCGISTLPHCYFPLQWIDEHINTAKMSEIKKCSLPEKHSLFTFKRSYMEVLIHVSKKRSLATGERLPE